MTRPHQQCCASFSPRAAFHCFPTAPMSGGSSSDWWDGWSGTNHGWHDSRSPVPTPTEQAPDEQVMNAVHRLQDQLQQTLALTQSRSHKKVTERATSVPKGNDAYAAMEAVTLAREWQAEAKRAYDLKFAEAAEAVSARSRHFCQHGYCFSPFCVQRLLRFSILTWPRISTFLSRIVWTFHGHVLQE